MESNTASDSQSTTGTLRVPSKHDRAEANKTINDLNRTESQGYVLDDENSTSPVTLRAREIFTIKSSENSMLDESLLNRYETEQQRETMNKAGQAYWTDISNQDSKKTRYLLESDTFIYLGSIDKNNLPNGIGIKIFKANGIREEGIFKNGELHGSGRSFFSDGNMHIGNYSRGCTSGNGKFLWPNGDKYEGMFKNRRFEGDGKVVFADGGIYTGDFKNSLFDGNGVVSYPSWSYSGGYKEGKRNGFGTESKYTLGKRNCLKQGYWNNTNLDGYGSVINLEAGCEKGLYRNKRFAYSFSGAGFFKVPSIEATKK